MFVVAGCLPKSLTKPSAKYPAPSKRAHSHLKIVSETEMATEDGGSFGRIFENSTADSVSAFIGPVAALYIHGAFQKGRRQLT